ncbi:hypothetical protein [Brevibacillus dissolubilis]|uniref:hypothetical protein n=1 Tax=Brevibacillus dissolubilis TaxID=1844116 RepID=UPI001115B9C3|nr:hypothetical protein [Brevibacillus dissolubilis]
MPNYFWFLLLILFSLAILFYTLYKKRDPMVMVQWFFLAGLSYVFELITLVYLNGYTYHPHLLPKGFADSIIGSIASQGLSVPITGAFIAAFDLGWIWILLISLLFVGTEILFLFLNLYEHQWWSIYLTAVMLPLSFWLSRKWYQLLKARYHPLVWFTTLYFCIFCLTVTIVWFISTVFYQYQMVYGWFIDAVRDHTAVNGTYYLVTSFVYTVILFLDGQYKKQAFLLILIILSDFFLYLDGILQITSPSWSILYFPVMHLLVLVLYTYANRWLLGYQYQRIRSHS